MRVDYIFGDPAPNVDTDFWNGLKKAGKVKPITDAHRKSLLTLLKANALRNKLIGEAKSMSYIRPYVPVGAGPPTVKEAGVLSWLLIDRTKGVPQVVTDKELLVPDEKGSDGQFLPVTAEDLADSKARLKIDENINIAVPIVEHFHPGGGGLSESDANMTNVYNGISVSILMGVNRNITEVHMAVGFHYNQLSSNQLSPIEQPPDYYEGTPADFGY